MNKKEAKKLKQDALDLLNQVAILLKDVEPETEWDYDNDGNEIENKRWFPENHFLATVKHICQDLSKNKENGEVMEYYDSYCF